jgi:hypothetical protein
MEGVERPRWRWPRSRRGGVSAVLGEFNLTNLRLILAFVAAVLPAACGSNSPASSPSPSLPATTTSLYFVSRPGEFIGGGQSRTISASDTPINAGVDCYENRIEVKVGTFPQDWSLTLAAPLTTRLVVGTYESAQRYPFQPRGVPGLDFSGDGRGCNTLTGHFVVTEASYLPTGAIDRFRATFEQRCEGTSPGVSGEVQLVSPTYRRVSC